MLVAAAVSSRNTSRSGSSSGCASNQASRAALTSARSCSAAYVAPLFPGDPMPLEEARQSARAGLHALLSQTVAQLAQEEARLLLGGRQDQRGMELGMELGMGLDGLRGVIAAHRLGRNLPLVAEALRPAAGTRNTD